MDGEMRIIIEFTKVWLSATLSLCYCYAIGKLIPKGIKRFICVIPIVCLFLYLPLCIDSVHLGGLTAFFIAWLANFKLLLFAFGLGPLSSPHPPISLPLFVTISCLPIKIQRTPFPKPHQNGHNNNNYENGGGHIIATPPPSSQNPTRKSPINYAIKGFLLAIIVKVYDYSDHIVSIHPKLIFLVYLLHIYFFLELTLVVIEALARAILGLELEPQFNEPYLSTSLQDFWGKRWNLMVTSILRPTVYKPTLDMFTRFTDRKWAPLPAVFATFLVSAFMHELMFFYLGRGVKPTWEVTWFFILHGVCLAAEIALKKAVNGKFRLPRIISGPLTVGFVVFTTSWLFFPQLCRCKVVERAFEEYAAMSALFKNAWSKFIFDTHLEG